MHMHTHTYTPVKMPDAPPSPPDPTHLLTTRAGSRRSPGYPIFSRPLAQGQAPLGPRSTHNSYTGPQQIFHPVFSFSYWPPLVSRSAFQVIVPLEATTVGPVVPQYLTPLTRT